MPFDAHANLAIATVTSATGAAGTTLTVGAGEGARFPAAPFNATVWPNGVAPTPLNAEIVRVTARTFDTLTIARTQEGTTAHPIILGDLIAATITKQWMTDVESGVNFPQVATAGNISLGGDLVINSPSGYSIIRTNSVPGADNQAIYIVSTPAGQASRGAYMSFAGNQHPSAGAVSFTAGDGAAGNIDFRTGPEALRGRIHRSGGFSWGSTTDPGVGALSLSGNGIVMTLNPFANGVLSFYAPVATAFNHVIFNMLSGVAGYIQSSGTTTVYSTTSDARLKTDRGRVTDTDVLQRTIVHAFDWTADGTPGRGVFAQEAAAVAPFAVSVGTDERDDEGRLTHPWGVDYSKYVPDLIVGWQQHDVQMAALAAQVASLIQATPRESWIGALYQRLVTALSAWWTPQRVAS